MSAASKRACPNCGLAQSPSWLRYRWQCPGCMARLRLASIKPIGIPLAAGLLLGVLAPTALWPAVVYGLLCLAFLLFLERSLVRREAIEMER